MAFLIGLALTPAGALIGSVLFIGILIGFSLHVPDFKAMTGVLTFGTIVGSMFAAPVTAFAFPLLHHVLRRRGTLTSRPFVLTGLIVGPTSVAVLMVMLWWQPSATMSSFGMAALALIADGAVSGAICGFLFARTMRWLLPAAWRHQPQPGGIA